VTRRTGQNPKVRIGRRANGQKYFFFQWWADVPGKEGRERRTEVVGLVRQLTKSEANRKRLEFILKLELNSPNYRIPCSLTFADAATYYREEFGPTMHRRNTFDSWDGLLRNHVEPDWKDVPIEHVTIKTVNEWAWRKHNAGISWGTIKDSLRTMHRVLTAFPENTAPTFSQKGLRIPERDKLQMKLGSRHRASFSWAQAVQIAEHLRNLDGLGDSRREQYSTAVLVAAASGLRCSELLALKRNDIDFKANTIRVDESSDQMDRGRIGSCKNVAAYRTVYLGDAEGPVAMVRLKQFLGLYPGSHDAVIFHSKRGAPLLQTTIVNQGLYLALEALGLNKAGLHAFRRGCNRRWELAGIVPAVIRQQMGHSSATMTRLYTGEIPTEDVAAAFSSKIGNQIVVLENMENEAAA